MTPPSIRKPVPGAPPYLSGPYLPPGEPAAAASRLLSLTGEPATHLVYAPGRVNLIGEHTDYNGGYVLPMAIDRGIYIAARPVAGQRVRLWSTDAGGGAAEFAVGGPMAPGEPRWSNYVRGVIAGLQRAGARVPGFDAVIHASLPVGGGLSSSAALEVAAALLGGILSGTALEPVALALLCQQAEHEFAGVPCGIMDQFAVVMGQAGHLLLIDCLNQETRQVPMPGGGVSVLVINTMVKHALTDGGYRARRNDCHEAARLMGVPDLRRATPELLESSQSLLLPRLYRRARHVITEDRRTLAAVAALERGAWAEVGGLMNGSHASLRDDFEVSCPELDAVVAAAGAIGTDGGIYGCRMTVGGFGGCCVALVDTGCAAEAAGRIAAAYRSATGIEPVCFVTRPSDGPSVLLQPGMLPS